MEKDPLLTFHFTSGKPEADEACTYCQMHYGQTDLDKANVHVVLGGDGSVLTALHQQIDQGVDLPVFGLNFGSVGWMCNDASLENLPERVQKAQKQEIFPLEMSYTLAENGQKKKVFAFNEFAFLRNSPQAAHLLMLLKSKNFRCIIPLEGDGVLLSTALGSTGYYANLQGEKKSIPSRFLGVRSINTKSPLDLVVTDETILAVNKKQGDKRPIMVEGDGQRFENISRAIVRLAQEKKKVLLFDALRQNRR